MGRTVRRSRMVGPHGPGSAARPTHQGRQYSPAALSRPSRAVERRADQGPTSLRMVLPIRPLRKTRQGARRDLRETQSPN